MSLVMNATSRNKNNGIISDNDVNNANGGFVVRVYRKTEQYGWQSMRPKNAKGQLAQVRAIPKLGCVVLHRIQVRIRLTTASSSSPQDQSNAADIATRAKSSVIAANNNDVLVVRRRHYILISSKLRSRSLVFKFKDLKSCLQFSDQLVQLNPNQTIIQRTSPSFDRNGNTLCDEEIPTNTLTHEQDMSQILSYVARLLYDDTFIKFCHNLESNVMACEDGVQLFQHCLVTTSAGDHSAEQQQSNSNENPITERKPNHHL